MKMTFQSKEARDAKARELSAQGLTVSKRSARRVVLSPNYVDDYDLTNASRNMFGGYDTEWFAVLYIVEAR